MYTNTLLREFHEHHPDVDIVLLPEQPDPATLVVATSAELERLARDSGGLLDTLLDRLSHHPSWPDEVTREGRWRRRSTTTGGVLVRREEVAVAVALEQDRGLELLRSTGNSLVTLGWQARAMAGRQPRLAARRGDFTVTATVDIDSLQVTLASAHLVSGTEVLS